MRKGALTYLAIPFGLGVFALIGTMLWAPGLPDALGILGLPGLAALASWVFAAVIAMMLAVATWDARGTYHVREHVLDMLPWIAGVAIFLLLSQHVTLR